jgi:hypothetical protein
MRIQETHYYAISNGSNTNYYRLQVLAVTVLGESDYRSGWFPESAVDALFGDVTAEGGTEAARTRAELESVLNEKLKAAWTAWLEEAVKPNAEPAKLASLLAALRRVRAAPGRTIELPDGAIEMEWDPAKGLILNHRDQKLVFILASDPNAVVGKIASFAENERTALAVEDLSLIISERVLNEVASKEAVEAVRQRTDQIIRAQLLVAKGVADSVPVSPIQAIKEIDTLLELLASVEP